MKCPACKTALKDDAKFCFKCGSRIPRCPTCGEPILTRSKFCGKDGTPIPQEVLELLPPESKPAAAPVRVTPASKPEDAAPKMVGFTAAGSLQNEEKPARVARACDNPMPSTTPVTQKEPSEMPRQMEGFSAAGSLLNENKPAEKPPVSQRSAQSRTGYETMPAMETHRTLPGRDNVQPAKKFCAKCGRVVADGQPLCPACRAKNAERHADRYERRESTPKKGNSMVILLVVATVIVCLLTIAVCAIAISGRLPFGDSKPEEDKTTVSDNSGSSYFDEDYDEEAMATDPVIIETQAPTAPPTQPPTAPPTEPPTEAPTEPEIDADPRLLYFIENCDSMYLSEDDIWGFDKEMCRIARNSLYAKSGRMFKDSELQEFFEQFDWYDPWVSPSAFTGDMFNKYQTANLNLISTYEREHGYR